MENIIRLNNFQNPLYFSLGNQSFFCSTTPIYASVINLVYKNLINDRQYHNNLKIFWNMKAHSSSPQGFTSSNRRTLRILRCSKQKLTNILNEKIQYNNLFSFRSSNLDNMLLYKAIAMFFESYCKKCLKKESNLFKIIQEEFIYFQSQYFKIIKIIKYNKFPKISHIQGWYWEIVSNLCKMILDRIYVCITRKSREGQRKKIRLQNYKCKISKQNFPNQKISLNFFRKNRNLEILKQQIRKIKYNTEQTFLQKFYEYIEIKVEIKNVI